jgi:ABC transporter DrrB family efflux protein
MTAISQSPAGSQAVTPPASAPGASLGRASLAIARRSLLKFFRTPQLLVVSTVQGAMFLLIFRYVFGGAIETGPVSYVDFMVPGFVTTTVLFAGSSASVAVAEDLEQGLFDRLRSLPIPRASVLSGRALADTTLLSWNLAVTAAVGFAVGFRLHGSVLAGAAAFLACVAFGFVFEWLFIFLGLLAGNAQAAQGMSLLVFPLTFVSSAYVPVKSMPGWLQAVAEHQPITVMVDSVRALCLGDEATATLGHSAGHYLVLAAVWSVVLIGVFFPLAVRRFHHR